MIEIVEYAIKVGERGFVHQNDGGRPGFVVKSFPTLTTNLVEIRKQLVYTESHYKAIGCADVAATVHIVSRTRTTVVTHGDWQTDAHV